MAVAQDFPGSLLYRRLHRHSFAGYVTGEIASLEGRQPGRAGASSRHDVELAATGTLGASSEPTGKKDRLPGASAVMASGGCFPAIWALDPLPLDIASR